MTELERLEQEQFLLNMKDHWHTEDYVYAHQLSCQIAALLNPAEDDEELLPDEAEDQAFTAFNQLAEQKVSLVKALKEEAQRRGDGDAFSTLDRFGVLAPVEFLARLEREYAAAA